MRASLQKLLSRHQLAVKESPDVGVWWGGCNLQQVHSPVWVSNNTFPRGAGVWLVEATGETFARPPRVRVHWPRCTPAPPSSQLSTPISSQPGQALHSSQNTTKKLKPEKSARVPAKHADWSVLCHRHLKTKPSLLVSPLDTRFSCLTVQNWVKKRQTVVLGPLATDPQEEYLTMAATGQPGQQHSTTQRGIHFFTQKTILVRLVDLIANYWSKTM